MLDLISSSAVKRRTQSPQPPRNMHLVCSFLLALNIPLQPPRLLAAGLTPAERSATALAFESAGFVEPVEFVEFGCQRRALLVPDCFYDDELLPGVLEALDAAADTPMPLTPVFVCSAQPGLSVGDASNAVELAVRESIDTYALRRPIPAAAAAVDVAPVINAEIDGAMVGGRWDASAVVAVDGLVCERLRAELMSLLCGAEREDGGEHGADREFWSAGSIVDRLDGAKDDVRGAGLGLQPSRLEALCAEPPEGSMPPAIHELQSRIAGLLHAANGGRMRIDVCRMPTAVFGEAVTPLAANAPTADDGAECYGWHIDADPALLPPSPWTDVFGRHPNRQPGRPRFVTALVYLPPKWRWPEWGAPTRFLDPPSGQILEVPPAPGRVVLLDADISHAVTAPTPAARGRPRYSLALKLILHPHRDDVTPAIAMPAWGPPVRIGSADTAKTADPQASVSRRELEKEEYKAACARQELPGSVDLEAALPRMRREDSNFLFITCQAGAEKLLKAELGRTHPEMRLAFSRPGLVTFKSANGAVVPSISIESSFARTYGVSVGQVTTAAEICELAQRVAMTSRPLCLHVWCRDQGGKRADHPLAVAERLERVASLRSELLLSAPDLWSSSEMAAEGEMVLSVIVGEVDEKYFVGLHAHTASRVEGEETPGAGRRSPSRRAHVPHAGGVFPGLEELPAEAPSRAYLKIEEAIRWADEAVDVRAGDVALEVGSAPGGAVHALLERGLSVHGIDPSPVDREHAPVVSSHPCFTVYKAKLGQWGLLEQLPRDVDWLLCDANIAPEEAVPHLAEMCTRFSPRLKGIFYTCKLGKKLWGNPTRLLDELERVKVHLGASAEFVSFDCVQLTANRQELLVLGVTKLGASRTSE